MGFDRQFAVKVFFSLVPPLVLIFVVLGSIVAGVATVNQAGAIGAAGAQRSWLAIVYMKVQKCVPSGDYGHKLAWSLLVYDKHV